LTDEDEEEYSGPAVKLTGDLDENTQFEIVADTADECLDEYEKLEKKFREKKHD